MVDTVDTVDRHLTHGVRVSVTELARLKGVSKQAISKKLDRLVRDGLVEAKRDGRYLTVNLAEYDTAAHETTNPARLAAQSTARQVRAETEESDTAIKDPTYTEALTRKAGFEADLKEIELRTRIGQLLPIEGVQEAVQECAEALVREIEQLPTAAEELAAAVSRGGVSALRDELKRTARRLREKLADSLTVLVTPPVAATSEGEADANL